MTQKKKWCRILEHDGHQVLLTAIDANPEEEKSPFVLENQTRFKLEESDEVTVTPKVSMHYPDTEKRDAELEGWNNAANYIPAIMGEIPTLIFGPAVAHPAWCRIIETEQGQILVTKELEGDDLFVEAKVPGESLVYEVATEEEQERLFQLLSPENDVQLVILLECNTQNIQ